MSTPPATGPSPDPGTPTRGGNGFIASHGLAIVACLMLLCGVLAAVAAGLVLNSGRQIEQAVQDHYGSQYTVQLRRKQGWLVYRDGQRVEGCRVEGVTFGLDDVRIECHYGVPDPDRLR